MKRDTVLIVDDESYIREFLAQILSEHYQVSFAKNGVEALEIARATMPSIVILDMIMPGLGGIEVCRLMRKHHETSEMPIIMLSALNDPEQRIEAFKSGADDFMSKPFSPEELIARINSKLAKARLAWSPQAQTTSTYGDILLRTDDLSLEVDGVKLGLGQVEYKILSLLLKKRGALVTRDELNSHIWGVDLPSDRALDPHITSLRKKLQNSKGELMTVYGKGYSIIIKDLEL